jgi:hypothetical protein
VSRTGNPTLRRADVLRREADDLAAVLLRAAVDRPPRDDARENAGGRIR